MHDHLNLLRIENRELRAERDRLLALLRAERGRAVNQPYDNDVELPDDRLPSEVRADERELLLALLRAARSFYATGNWHDMVRYDRQMQAAIRACEGIDGGG